jgi:transcriptional regulator with XRE-family HTH domain
MSFELRLKLARTNKGNSKNDLANLVALHYSQIERYENKVVQSLEEILGKSVNSLNSLKANTDFLMNGRTQDLAINTISDKELSNQFKYIEKFSEADKSLIKILLDAFIIKKEIQQLAI